MIFGIKTYVGLFGILSLFSWSLWTTTVSQISSIEKAFGLTSSESGWLLTWWEIGYVICSIFASCLANKVHLPRYIGVATIICGLSAWVFALPHFIALSSGDMDMSDSLENNTTLTLREPEKNLDKLCISPSITNNVMSFVNETVPSVVITDTPSSPSKSASSKSLAYALFIIGMILQGVGKAPCFPYSSKYVDDNIDKQKTGFYLSIASSIGIFGLVLGYGLGSIVNNIYVTLKGTHLATTDQRFIGAWWLAFVIAGFATIVIAFPMFCFPRRIKMEINSADAETDTTTRRTSTQKLKRLFLVLWQFAKSPMYTLVMITTCCQILAVASFLGFEPKYMEAQFAIPQWKANIILGVVSITSFSLGNLVGGYITKRWNMTPFGTLKTIFIFYTVVLICVLINTFLGCDQQDIYNPLENSTNLIQVGCNCNTTEFLPICGSDSVTYFSPCHAGCTGNTGKTFSNCSLIPGGSAETGVCSSGCSVVIPYSIVKFTMNFVDACVGIPIFLVFLRSAGEEHKALAVGLSTVIISLAAWTPGPIIGGIIIDSTCLFWNTASTSTKYCSYYEIAQQRYKLHAFMIGMRITGLGFLSIALFKSRKLMSWYKAGETSKHTADKLDGLDGDAEMTPVNSSNIQPVDKLSNEIEGDTESTHINSPNNMQPVDKLSNGIEGDAESAPTNSSNEDNVENDSRASAKIVPADGETKMKAPLVD